MASERGTHMTGPVSPPGETLREVMLAMGISVRQVASRSGNKISGATVRAILNGRFRIDGKHAKLLCIATGVPASRWLELERKYQVYQEELKQ